MQHTTVSLTYKEMAGTEYIFSGKLPDFDDLVECSQITEHDLEKIEEIKNDLIRECNEIEKGPSSVATSGYVSEHEEYTNNEDELKRELQKIKDLERGRRNREKRKREKEELNETYEKMERENKRLKEQTENLEQQIHQLGITHPHIVSSRIIRLASEQSTGTRNEEYERSNELYVELFTKLKKTNPEVVQTIMQPIFKHFES